MAAIDAKWAALDRLITEGSASLIELDGIRLKMLNKYKESHCKSVLRRSPRIALKMFRNQRRNKSLISSCVSEHIP